MAVARLTCMKHFLILCVCVVGCGPAFEAAADEAGTPHRIDFGDASPPPGMWQVSPINDDGAAGDGGDVSDGDGGGSASAADAAQALVVGALEAGLPAASSGVCSIRTCPQGCCDPTGTCQPGDSTDLCGNNGQRCMDCTNRGVNHMCGPSNLHDLCL